MQRKSKRTIIASTLQPLVYDLREGMMEVIENYIHNSSIDERLESEIEDEMKAIAAAFNISRESAKYLMINELGFEETDFEGVRV